LSLGNLKNSSDPATKSLHWQHCAQTIRCYSLQLGDSAESAVD